MAQAVDEGSRFVARRPSRRIVAALTAVAVLGGGGALALTRGEAHTTAAKPAALQADAAPVVPAGDVAPRATTATTPAEAIDGFLAAEAAGEVSSGFDFLSDADRATYATPAGWEAAHAQLLPRLRSFEVGGVTESADRAEITASLRYTPSLDEFLGLVPAEATATWIVVRTGDAWGVALDQSTITPVYADDATAPAAVERWAESRQQCAATGEWEGTLLGFPGLAAGLCEADGSVAVGPVAPLAEVDASALTAAFGGDVVSWARVVSVTSPVPLRAVVAPVGDEWLVVGVLGPGLGGS